MNTTISVFYLVSFVYSDRFSLNAFDTSVLSKVTDSTVITGFLTSDFSVHGMVSLNLLLRTTHYIWLFFLLQITYNDSVTFSTQRLDLPFFTQICSRAHFWQLDLSLALLYLHYDIYTHLNRKVQKRPCLRHNIALCQLM